MQLALILHNIRSVHNVGSIFRTADATGVSKILLSGYSPAPIDQFGQLRSDFAKVSLGAEQTVPWAHTETFSEAVGQLKAEGCTVVAVEIDARAVPIYEYTQKLKNLPAGGQVALVLGNEVDGLSPDELALCDAVVEIPMLGKKESLNVSVAAGVALYAFVS